MSNADIDYKPWQVTKKIGQGSFGIVYEIEKEEYGVVSKSALKVISIPPSVDELDHYRASGMSEQNITTYYESVLGSLMKEFVQLAKLKGHTNIVSYEDHKVIPHEDGLGWEIYIRMELLTSLTKAMIASPLERDRVIKLGIDICTALSLCEKMGMIHRDIKPDNIFVSEFGDFKLGDFGVARTIAEATKGMSRKGTENYMAPEIYRNAAMYDMTVDIYSLGLVLYQLMNGGRLPFLTEQITVGSLEEALGKRMSGVSLPAPSEADREFSRIILKACAYSPDDRYQTAEEMKADLERLKTLEIPVKNAEISKREDSCENVKRTSYTNIEQTVRNKEISKPEKIASVNLEDKVYKRDINTAMTKTTRLSENGGLVIVLALAAVILGIVWIYGKGDDSTKKNETTEPIQGQIVVSSEDGSTESDISRYVYYGTEGEYYYDTYYDSGDIENRFYCNKDNTVQYVDKYDEGGRIVARYYYENGDITKEKMYDESGNVEMILYYSDSILKLIEWYDADGVLETEIEYYENGNRKKGTWYESLNVIQSIKEYDLNGNCITSVAYSNGVIESSYRSQYNEFGGRIRTDFYNADGVMYVYQITDEFDSRWNAVRLTEYNPNGTAGYTCALEYDDDSNVIKRIWRYPDGSLDKEIEYEFDESGNLIKEVFTYPDGSTETITY